MFAEMNPRRIALAIGLTVMLLAGCKSEGTSHEKAVNAADDRWRVIRGNMSLQVAQQQFDTGDLDQAEKTITQAIVTDPKNARMHVLAGRCALERGQLERALQRLETARELDDKSPEPYYYQGIVLQRWQRFDQALEKYRGAYERRPDSASYLLAIAEMLVATDKPDEAMALLADKKTYFDQNAGIRVALGELHALRGEFDKAADEFREASLMRSDDLQIIERLGKAQLAAGKHADAIRTFERLLLDRNYAQRKDIRHALANAYTQVKRTKDARDQYLRITQLDPNDADAWVKLGEMAFAQEDYSGALSAANRVMQLAPARPDGYMLAGLVWQHRGRTEEALRMFDRAAEADPQANDAVILRGITLEKAGKSAAAAEAYAEALKRQPEDQRAKVLLANLNTNKGGNP